MKIGLIGAGRQGRRRAKALADFGDELVIVADVNPDSAKALAETYGCSTTSDWHDVATDPKVDAVIICTPNDLHATISIAVARNGKHVLCEKPLARNPEEAAEILKIVRETGVKLKCGFTLRHHPAIKQAKEWVDSGVLGKIMYLRCIYGICGRIGYDAEWRGKREIAGGGQLMDQGVHVLDLFRWFAGEFEKVVGYTTTMYWKVAPLEDNAFALLRNTKGQVGFLHVSWTEWKNQFSFEVFGDKAYAKVKGLGGSYGVEHISFGVRDLGEPFKEQVTEYREEDRSLLEEWKEFTSAVKEDGEPLGNAYDGWSAVRLAYAIYESSRTGQEVNLTWSPHSIPF